MKKPLLKRISQQKRGLLKEILDRAGQQRHNLLFSGYDSRKIYAVFTGFRAIGFSDQIPIISGKQ